MVILSARSALKRLSCLRDLRIVCWQGAWRIALPLPLDQTGCLISTLTPDIVNKMNHIGTNVCKENDTPDVNWYDPQSPREGTAQPTARVHPTPEEARPIDIKITTRMVTYNEASALDDAVAAVMQFYQNADLDTVGTVVDTLQRDWIYVFHEAEDDVRLLAGLKPLLEAKLGRSVTVESFRHLDAYPGAHWMYGYTPDELVLNRR